MPKPAAFTLPPVPGMSGIDERIANLLETRPTTQRPLVHQDDPAAVDEALRQATEYGMQVGNFVTNPVMASLQALLGSQGIQPGDPQRLQRLGLTPEQAAYVANPENWLEGQAQWKRRGIPRAMIETATQGQSPLHSDINLRNTVYHATHPEAVESILEMGKIMPGGVAPAYATKLGMEDPGVSVSRTPRGFPKPSRAVSFEIDASKMPPSRPYAEPQYEKTTSRDPRTFYPPGVSPPAPDAWTKVLPLEILEQVRSALREGADLKAKDIIRMWHRSLPYDQQEQVYPHLTPFLYGSPPPPSFEAVQYHGQNPQFEFENRTFNQPIDLSAVRRAIIDKEGLRQYAQEVKEQTGQKVNINQLIKQLQGLLKTEHGLPVDVMQSGREMQSLRARGSR